MSNEVKYYISTTFLLSTAFLLNFRNPTLTGCLQSSQIIHTFPLKKEHLPSQPPPRSQMTGKCRYCKPYFLSVHVVFTYITGIFNHDLPYVEYPEPPCDSCLSSPPHLIHPNLSPSSQRYQAWIWYPSRKYTTV